MTSPPPVPGGSGTPPPGFPPAAAEYAGFAPVYPQAYAGKPPSGAGSSWRVVLIVFGVLAGLVVAGVILFATFGVKLFEIQKDAALVALRTAEMNPGVEQALGRPLEWVKPISRHITLGDHNRVARMELPVRGSRGRGTIYAYEVKHGAVWDVVSLEVLPDALGAARIEVVGEGPASSGAGYSR